LPRQQRGFISLSLLIGYVTFALSPSLSLALSHFFVSLHQPTLALPLFCFVCYILVVVVLSCVLELHPTMTSTTNPTSIIPIQALHPSSLSSSSSQPTPFTTISEKSCSSSTPFSSTQQQQQQQYPQKKKSSWGLILTYLLVIACCACLAIAIIQTRDRCRTLFFGLVNQASADSSTSSSSNVGATTASLVDNNSNATVQVLSAKDAQYGGAVPELKDTSNGGDKDMDMDGVRDAHIVAASRPLVVRAVDTSSPSTTPLAHDHKAKRPAGSLAPQSDIPPGQQPPLQQPHAPATEVPPTGPKRIVSKKKLDTVPAHTASTHDHDHAHGHNQNSNPAEDTQSDTAGYEYNKTTATPTVGSNSPNSPCYLLTC
ncbi:MAG: hypothetical protein J3R72DRAFT_503958, partial [Linnemannia gamsii]